MLVKVNLLLWRAKTLIWFQLYQYIYLKIKICRYGGLAYVLFKNWHNVLLVLGVQVCYLIFLRRDLTATIKYHASRAYSMRRIHSLWWKFVTGSTLLKFNRNKSEMKWWLLVCPPYVHCLKHLEAFLPWSFLLSPTYLILILTPLTQVRDPRVSLDSTSDGT